MEPIQILGFLLLLLVLFLAFWIPAEILRKAGFPRWIALFIPLTGFVGLAVFAFIEWPVERELAWLRWRSGEPAVDLLPLVERYAVELERRSDWKKAAEIYTDLSLRAPADENGEYYRNCVKRLKEHLDV